MPVTSIKMLQKQVSMDACEPLRQGITLIDKKIVNLENRKARLDVWLYLRNNGKDLNNDQLEAISKYDAVIQQLEFAQDFKRQLINLAADTTKSLKKQAKKEEAKKAREDLSKVKELLLIQEVLAHLGTDSIRDDFLQGKYKVKLTQEELQSIDDLYHATTPKEEEPMPFIDMLQTPAEVMMALLDGEDKEAFGTTFAVLKIKLMDIAHSVCFDTTCQSKN